MRVNGVTFVESEVVKLTKDEFVAMHIDVFWLGLPKDKRKTRLSSVYDRIIDNSNSGGGGA